MRPCRLKWVHQLIDEESHRWKEDVLSRFLYQVDVEKILKLEIPRRGSEDMIAWHYEKSRMFSVRSAYWLGIVLKELETSSAPCSANPDGARSAWKKLWKLSVPHKVRIFAWKLIHGGLASKCNKKRRKITQEPIYDLCGRKEETEHHAVIRCDHAYILREAMRECWDLPPEEMLKYSGAEWLLLLIDKVDARAAASLILILWRALFVRNGLTHSGKWLPIMGSVTFLSGY